MPATVHLETIQKGGNMSWLESLDIVLASESFPNFDLVVQDVANRLRTKGTYLRHDRTAGDFKYLWLMVPGKASIFPVYSDEGVMSRHAGDLPFSLESLDVKTIRKQGLSKVIGMAEKDIGNHVQGRVWMGWLVPSAERVAFGIRPGSGDACFAVPASAIHDDS